MAVGGEREQALGKAASGVVPLGSGVCLAV